MPTSNTSYKGWSNRKDDIKLFGWDLDSLMQLYRMLQLRYKKMMYILEKHRFKDKISLQIMIPNGSPIET